MFVTVDFLEDSGLELGQVGLSTFWAKVPLDGTFRVPKSLSDLDWGLVWHQFTCKSQLFDGFSSSEVLSPSGKNTFR
jgi:hypothetical protein